MAHRAVRPSTDRFERKREAILDAATLILNRHGVKGLTLGVAAAAVDLSTTSVTYYFKRKDDLAAASITRGIETLHRAGRPGRAQAYAARSGCTRSSPAISTSWPRRTPGRLRRCRSFRSCAR